MSETTELPTIEEIEGLWYELKREMVASRQVVSFTTDVIDVDGETSECNVTRVGLFNAVCDGKYLEYATSKGQYAFLPRQPAGRYTKTAKQYWKMQMQVKKLNLVLTQLVLLEGSLLANLIQTPSLAGESSTR